MNYYQYLFSSPPGEEREILIALLTEIGFEAFEETDEQLKAFTTINIPLSSLKEINQLHKVSYSVSEIEAVNWNAAWESSFKPVTVFYPCSDKIFVNIHADFHPPVPSAEYNIIITPKMSFGTGHHATTYGMIECMSSLELKDKDVIDFGTGTGVLAILAEKLGARCITAIDNDEWSIRNAAENIRVNKCKNIRLITAQDPVNAKPADIILANINLNVIIANLPSLVTASKKFTQILLSGMLHEDLTVITTALINHNIRIKNIYESDNWIVILSELMH